MHKTWGGGGEVGKMSQDVVLLSILYALGIKYLSDH